MTITCRICGVKTKAKRKDKKFCYRCCHLKNKSRKVIKRKCKWCKKLFTISRGASKKETGKRYCSPSHSLLGARRSRLESALRRGRGEPKRYGGRPSFLTEEERTARKREGMADRFFRKFPDRPRSCQSCGENRIVELAHKTARNGAWRTFGNTRSEDVWILCPTCHRLLDRKILTIQELGLS